MTIAEKRKQIFDALTPLLKPKGFKLYKIGGNPGYVYYKDNIAIDFGFSFFKSGKITFSRYGITHYEVEDYILALNKFPEVYKDKKKDHLGTVYDWANIGKNPNNFESDTPEQIDNGIALIKEYILGDGQTFLDTYTHLPNILKRMDELEANNILWGNRNEGGILAGTVDFLFRGLIISKLCNDSNYIHKVEKVNLLLSDGANDEWLPYYEKIKKDLETIEP